MLKMIILPRQARDKHRERNSKAETRFVVARMRHVCMVMVSPAPSPQPPARCWRSALLLLPVDALYAHYDDHLLRLNGGSVYCKLVQESATLTWLANPGLRKSFHRWSSWFRQRTLLRRAAYTISDGGCLMRCFWRWRRRAAVATAEKRWRQR